MKITEWNVKIGGTVFPMEMTENTYTVKEPYLISNSTKEDYIEITE